MIILTSLILFGLVTGWCWTIGVTLDDFASYSTTARDVLVAYLVVWLMPTFVMVLW